MRYYLSRSALCLLVVVATAQCVCPAKEFFGCVVQLSSQRVHYDTNLSNVLFNITSEAKLIHACRTYENVLPCFEQRLPACGSRAQRSLLEKGKRLHTFMCAPFALQRQRIFLREAECIQLAIKEVDPKCKVVNEKIAKKIDSCSDRCAITDKNCHASVDSSRYAACLLQSVDRRCGGEATQFYIQLQQVLTNKEYPTQCNYEKDGSKFVLPPSTSSFMKKCVPTDGLTTYGSQTTFVTVYPKGSTDELKVHSIAARRRMDPKSRVRTRNTFHGHLFVPVKVNVTFPKQFSQQGVPVTAVRAFNNNYSNNNNNNFNNNQKPPQPGTPGSFQFEMPRVFHPARPIPDSTLYVPTTTTTIPPFSFSTGAPKIQKFTFSTATPVTSQFKFTTGTTPAPTTSPSSVSNTTPNPAFQWNPNQFAFTRSQADNGKSSTPANTPWYFQRDGVNASTAQIGQQSFTFTRAPQQPQGHPTLAPTASAPGFKTYVHFPPNASESQNTPPPAMPKFNFVYNPEPTPEPFKINIKFMDDDEEKENPWYVKNLPDQSPMPEETSTAGVGETALAAVKPIINQIKNQNLTLSEIGQQANNYLSGVMNALTSPGAGKNDMAPAANEPMPQHSDPWRSFIDAVAPTIQKVNPDIIPRLRQEIERIDQQQRLNERRA